ncbi:hypothetical protein Ahy_B07g086924 [Arachis hypogaea]|uniref:Uncharacterized protein n=1 Tax=Arachis hypogaea TaxID=3818 RepID=A0A444YAT9_ARAHY|nr:hypothetical protein Ahy_B07g086924 [Arachis hypogaea]
MFSYFVNFTDSELLISDPGLLIFLSLFIFAFVKISIHQQPPPSPANSAAGTATNTQKLSWNIGHVKSKAAGQRNCS